MTVVRKEGQKGKKLLIFFRRSSGKWPRTARRTVFGGFMMFENQKYIPPRLTSTFVFVKISLGGRFLSKYVVVLVSGRSQKKKRIVGFR